MFMFYTYVHHSQQACFIFPCSVLAIICILISRKHQQPHHSWSYALVKASESNRLQNIPAKTQRCNSQEEKEVVGEAPSGLLWNTLR